MLVAKDIFQSPRSWIELSHNVEQYTDIRGVARGGHFLKLENPGVVCEDLEQFVFQTLGASKCAKGIRILEDKRAAALLNEKVGWVVAT